jgi:hypothetical protein
MGNRNDHPRGWPRVERRATMNRLACPTRLAWTTLVLVALMLLAKGASAQEGIRPLSPDGTAYGLTLTDWAVAYFQWFHSIPRGSSPDLLLDKTRVRAGIGQHGPVWFLPHAFFDEDLISGTFTFTIPVGKSILLNVAATNGAEPPGRWTEEQLRAQFRKGGAEAYLDRIAVMEVSLDGVAIPDVKGYRVQTPLFTLTLPPGNLFGLPMAAGKDPRAVSIGGGYFLLFPPLAVGKHVLVSRTEGIEGTTAFKREWTFNLIVQNPNEPLP